MDRIVVVGASAGGVTALEKVVSGLPVDFPAALVVVLHLLPDHHSGLPDIISRAGRIAGVRARDGAPLQPGQAYVAVADRYVLVEGTALKAGRGQTASDARSTYCSGPLRSHGGRAPSAWCCPVRWMTGPPACGR